MGIHWKYWFQHEYKSTAVSTGTKGKRHMNTEKTLTL